jgi:hypothetical protein
VGQIIYHLTRGVPRGQITRYFGHHSSSEGIILSINLIRLRKIFVSDGEKTQISFSSHACAAEVKLYVEKKLDVESLGSAF